MRKIILLTFLFQLSLSAIAGHRAGGSYSWVCVGPNTYKIRFTALVDCAHAPDAATIFCLSGSLAGDPNNGSYSTNLVSSATTVVSHPVAFCSAIPDCQAGGDYNWITEVVYEKTITLIAPISPSYTIKFCDGGNRPTGDNFGGAQGSFYNEATFKITVPCNSSAYPTSFPDVFYCMNKSGCIINNFIDPDGDSLSFSLGNCLDAAGVSIDYIPPYSATNPLNSTSGWSVSSQGNICFFPTIAMKGPVCMKVKEYRAGVLIATTTQDIFINVIDCPYAVTGPTITSISSTSVSCFGGSNGSATVTASGGATPYIYSWAPSGGTAATITGRPPGIYTVTVQSSVGCSTTATVSIGQPAAPVIATTSITNVTCNGAGNGIATASVSGGTAGYTYLWSPSGGTGATASNLVPGMYTVTVKDSKLCQTIATATITQPTILAATITASANVSCFGGSNGSATASASGGVSPYNYSWNTTPVQTVATATNLAAGPNVVTVTDAKGCIVTKTVVITQPPALSLNTSQTNVSCFNGSNGSATVTVSGGSPAYLYNWIPSGGTTSNANLLTAGSYTVGVTDNNGCSANAQVIITQPTAISISYTSANVSCFGGANGSATIAVTGGLPTYSYAWSPSGGNSPIASGLSSGTYTVIVSDTKGCQATSNITITQPLAITSTITSTNLSCNGSNNGSATVTASGGSSPYAYLWSPGGSTSAIINGLSIGSYTVTISDSKSCLTTKSVIITQPTAITGIITTTNVSCNGGTNGNANINSSGGTSPYSYSWNTTPVQNTATANNIPAGNYTVAVTDSKNCIAYAIASITEPPVFSAAIASLTNVSCFGGNNGAASVSAGGGTPGYTYNWVPSGGNATTATGLPVGSYTVNVTDTKGCVATATISINQPSLLVSSISATNVSCFGGTNGSSSVSASGGTPGYTYTWSPTGGSSSLANGLSAGNYTVTVKDNKGCQLMNSVTISQPSGMTLSTTSVNATCGGNNGQASVSVSGGNAPYGYSWNSSPVQNTSTATSLPAGSYIVTVTDASGCSANATVIINNIGGPTITLGTITNVSCFGGSNGSASVSASGGSPSYSYNWLPSGGTTANATGLSAGIYTVTVTDVNSCKATAIITINQPTALNLTTTHTDVSCNGGTNGSATVTVTGGTPSYTYNWAPSGGNSNTANNLTAGNYSVTITDSKGCSSISSVTITQPTAINVTTSIINAVSCNGGSNGTASVSVSGGTAGYTYTWAPTGGNSSVNSGLSSGIYTVFVADAKGCSKSATVNVTQPSSINISITSTNVSCYGGSNGSATASASNGTAPYTYFWMPNGISGANASGLSAGTHTVIVTDANGCQRAGFIAITQPPILTVTTSVNNATCFGNNNGWSTASVSGGTAPYAYSWSTSPIQTNASAFGLSAGTYIVTITDNKGCVAGATSIISQSSAITLSTSKTQVSCFGGNNGSASVNANGGTPGYTYNWMPTGGTSSTATGLIAGTYTVVVTDLQSCTSSATVTIIQPTLLTSSITTYSNVLCYGGNNGSASVSANGGTPGYTYSWTPTGGSLAAANDLIAGSYTVVTNDNKGCSSVSSITITQPSTVTASIGSLSPVSCNGGNNGSVTVNVAGGTVPYTYVWTPFGGTAATATNLSAGIYTVTINDANACSTSLSVTISQSSQLITNTSYSNVICFGGTNGSAYAFPSGGTAPYTFSWNTSPVQTSSVATGLSAGSYTVTTTDAKGCGAINSVTIYQPSAFSITYTQNNVSCNGGNDGSASVNVSGGTPGYTYNWMPTGGTNATAVGLSSGIYTLNVTDTKGCNSSSTITISQPVVLSSSVVVNNNVSCNGGNNGSATINVSGGTPGYTYLWAPGGYTSQSINNLYAGTYTITSSDSKGCIKTNTLSVTQPPVLSVIITATNISCNGGSNGSATANVSGGTSPYTYQWLPTGGNASSATGLTAGNYSVNVTDAKGCSIQGNINLTEPLSLSLSINSFSNVSCFGACNGSAQVSAAGGTSPYSYLWAPGGQSSASVNNLCAGAHTVTATDLRGCSRIILVNISQPSAVTAVSSVTNINCYNVCNGSATIVGSGGTGPYTFLWVPGFQTTPSLNNLCAGTYTVSVKDANACPKNIQVVITQPTATTLTTSVTNANCGSSNGGACVSVSGGSPPFNYQWNDPLNQTSACAVNLSGNAYVVTVTDNNSCVFQAVANVNNISGPTVSITASSNLTCANANNGTANATIGGGSPPYTVLWLPSGQTNAFATGLASGTHIIKVTDNAGCIASTSTVLSQPTILGSAITAVNNINCNTNCNGSATVTAGGGTTPYSYLWNNPSAQTTSTVGALCAGSYIVNITDGNGCTTSKNVLITQPSPILISTTSVNTISCYGGSNGLIQVSVTGGSTGYTYSWTPTGGSGSIASGLSAGSYTLAIKDSKNCSATASYTLSQPAQLTTSMNQTNILCNGDANGTATVNALGGTSGYNYSWSPSISNSSFANNLMPGTYIVTVLDANGCSIKDTAIITQPTPIILTTSATQVSCLNGNNGTVSVSASGGSSGYLYSWSSIPVQNTATAVNLTVGIYTVTVTDSNGCSAEEEESVTGISPLVASTSFMNVSCNGGNDGSASVSVSGGTSSYSYIWMPTNATSSTVNGLSAGNYAVTITDALGCTTAASLTISQPNALIVSVTVLNNVTCNGGNNGSLLAGASGGTPNYFYIWAPTGGTTNTASNLSAGTYSLIVIDSKNCRDTTTTIVTQPSPILISTTQTNVSCFGGNNGSATSNVSGGTSGYSYSWFPFGGNNATATGLIAGNYTLTVIDNQGCSEIKVVTITQPQVFTSAISANTNLSCFGSCNGTALAVASGGTGPYSYAWLPGNQTSANVNNLCAGNYTVTATDNNGCLTSSSITINQPTAITNTINTTNISCNGSCDGSIVVVTSGGVGPYTFQWNPNVQSGSFASNLCSGIYSITVTDNNGCSKNITVPLIQPTLISANINTITSTCGNANGTATVLPSGGTPPYTFQWNDPMMQTTPTATNLSAGNYAVNITDLNGCIYSLNVIIPGTSNPIITSMAGTSPTCYGSSTGSASVTVTSGTSPYTYLWNDPFNQTNSSANGLVAGTFVVVVKDVNGCSATDSITLTQPSQLKAIISANDSSLCYGQSVQLFCSATGGNPGYTFYWNTGYIGTGPVTYSPTIATIYNVYAVDASGCQSIPAAIPITVMTPITVITTNTSVCANQPSTLTASASGGTGGPYIYTWSNGYIGQAQPVTLSSNQTYIVTVGDGCSALAFDTINVTVNPLATGNILISDTSGCEPFTLQATGSSDIGTTYTWNFGDGSPISSGMNLFHTYYASGNYSITLIISTSAGCQTIINNPQTITVHPSPQANFTVSPSIMPLPDNTTVNFTNLSTGATNFIWSFGDGSGSYVANPTHHYNLSGEYLITLIAVNSLGCSDTASVKSTSENYLHFANAFTPNPNGSNGGVANYSDLSNDVFFPTWAGVAEYHLMIFNKWGELLFESRDVTVGWDGYYKGKISQEDVYVWKAFATFKDGSKFAEAGDVTLLR